MGRAQIALDCADAMSAGLAALADPLKAGPMAAYLKTEQPFYGVQAKDRHRLVREVGRAFVPEDAQAYRDIVETLWARPHREEQYAAIGLACRHRRFISSAALPMYEAMIRSGGWWDLVDEIAAKLVGTVLRNEPETLWPILECWIEDEDLWIRRTPLLAQLKHKEATDQVRLFDWCLRRADESEFFIRKAIGWALRQHAAVAPEAVAAFLRAHREQLSGLSYREAARGVRREGVAL